MYLIYLNIKLCWIPCQCWPRWTRATPATPNACFCHFPCILPWDSDRIGSAHLTQQVLVLETTPAALWWLRHQALKSIAACCLEVTAESDRHRLSVLHGSHSLDHALWHGNGYSFIAGRIYSKIFKAVFSDQNDQNVETCFDPYRTYSTSKALQKPKLLLVSSGTSSKCRLALSSIEEMLQWELCCYLPIHMMIFRSCPWSLYHSGK